MCVCVPINVAHNVSVNVTAGPLEERSLMTGLHVVCDIYCNSCETIVGWKYERAYEQSQKYKVGKFILGELLRVCTCEIY